MKDTLTKGFISEQEFLIACASMGGIISKPMTPVAYDFIVDFNRKLYRVQVKSSYLNRGKQMVNIHKRSINGSMPYPENSWDAIVFKIESDWYIFDQSIILPSSIAIHPKNDGKYKEFKNNWSVFGL